MQEFDLFQDYFFGKSCFLFLLDFQIFKILCLIIPAEGIIPASILHTRYEHCLLAILAC